MRLTQNNDVVHAFTPDRSDQPFDKAILPRRGGCSGLVPDAHGTQSARDDNAIDSIPISDHIARSHVPRKSLRYPTCHPRRRRVDCDESNEISAIKSYHHEAAAVPGAIAAMDLFVVDKSTERSIDLSKWVAGTCRSSENS
jgi:hypothetical protein